MFGRQPRLPIDFEMGLPIDVLGDSCSKTRYVHKLKRRLNFAYKKAKEMSQKQAQKYKLSYDRKVKESQLQVDDIVLVKRVAWKGRHKIRNKWEPSEYVVVAQPNLKVPVYKVKSLEDNKERVLHRSMLLPLGIKLFLKKSLIMTLKRNQSWNSITLKGKFLRQLLSLLFLLT